MSVIERLGGETAIIAGILEEFRALSRVPHSSGHEAAACACVLERLAALGLSPVRDALGNIMADVSAAPGQEAVPLAILQGHLDMVCAVRPGGGFDPLRSSVRPVVEGGFLKTDGRSSLGADNNLGNAAVLWLLGQKIAHGPLRLLFTVAEEVGLMGARELDPAWLAGADYLINTDGFHLGAAVVASAGGRRETFSRPLSTAPTQGARAYRVSLAGYPGGHSGDDIHKGRPNPVKLLGEYLATLGAETGFELAELSGGTGHNVIPSWAEAVVVLGPGDAPRPGMEPLERLPAQVWTAPCRDAVLGMINGLFNGVYAWHKDFSGVVAASANLGRVCVEDGKIELWAFIRCTDGEDERVLAAGHAQQAERWGFSLWADGYPGWPGDADNPLARGMDTVFRRETGREMRITAVHVGLEPSFFRQKAPNLVMVSTGPDILDAHSVDERAPLGSIPPYAALLAGTLEELGSIPRAPAL